MSRTSVTVQIGVCPMDGAALEAVAVYEVEPLEMAVDPGSAVYSANPIEKRLRFDGRLVGVTQVKHDCTDQITRRAANRPG